MIWICKNTLSNYLKETCLYSSCSLWCVVSFNIYTSHSRSRILIGYRFLTKPFEALIHSIVYFNIPNLSLLVFNKVKKVKR